MSEPHPIDPNDPPRRHWAAFLLAWLDTPAVKNSLPTVLVVSALALGLADFVIKRHSKVPIAENVWGFYALVGFVAFVLIVLSGWPLRILLSRSEDYYPERRKRAAERARAG